MSYKISLAFDTFNDYTMEFVTAYFDSTTKIYKDKKKFNSKDIQSLLEKNHGNPIVFDWSEKICFEKEEEKLLSEFTDKPIFVIYDNKIYNLSPFGKENYVLMNEAPFAYLYYAAPKSSSLSSFASALVIQKQSKKIQRIFQKTIQQTKNNKEPFTFISYSHKDNISGKPVTKFAHELETIGMNVFFDDFNFIPGVNWYEVAEKAILDYRCKYMLCFISSNYIQSQACIEEIETALKQRVTILLFDPNQILKDSNLLSEYRRKRCVHIVNNRKELLKFYNLRSLNKKMKEKNITSFYNLNDLNEASQSFFISNIRSEQKELETEINEKNLNVTIDGKSYTIQKYKTPVEKYFLTNEIVEIYSEYSTNEFIPYSEKIQRSLGVGIISSIFLILLFGFYVYFCITEHAPLPITIIVSMLTLLWVLAPLYIIVSLITVKHLEKTGHKIDISKILKTKGLMQNVLAEYAFYNLANEGYFEEK